MNKHIFNILLTALCIICYQNSFAHGVGGGNSYTFDQNDRSADQEAKTKAAEVKKDTENWDDFMSEFNKNKKTKKPGKKSLEETNKPDL